MCLTILWDWPFKGFKTWKIARFNSFLGLITMYLSLREKCSYTEFSWSVFSCIWTECRKIRTRKNSVFGHFTQWVYIKWLKLLILCIVQCLCMSLIPSKTQRMCGKTVKKDLGMMDFFLTVYLLIVMHLLTSLRLSRCVKKLFQKILRC